MEISSVLEKVRKLLDQAEHPRTGKTEADGMRARADEMMRKYAIEEAQLEAARALAKGASLRSRIGKLEVELCDAGNPLKYQYGILASTIATHVRCKLVVSGMEKEWTYGKARAIVVGHESDLRFFDMMVTTLRLHMSSHVEPQPDVNKPFDENVYLLHEAGVKWERIAQLMNKEYARWEPMGRPVVRDQPKSIQKPVDEWTLAVRPSKKNSRALVPWPDGHRLINAYKRWCAKIGETPHAIQSPKNYQMEFASSYNTTIQMRLAALRRDDTSRSDSALVLRSESVEAVFNDLFPPESLSYTDVGSHGRYDAKARAAGAGAAAQADLGQPRMGGRKAIQ